MKFRQLVALATIVACLAGVQPGLRAAQQAPATPISGQRISGKVLQADRKTPVANHAVQLRNLDKSTIVGKDVTDGSGAFSFAVTEPGKYIVEAVKGGGIVAVGKPVTLISSPIITNVILPLSVVANLTVFGIAAGAGILGWVIAGEGPTSPER